MSLAERLEKEYITAYKAKDTVRLGVLRFIKTALKNFQVEHLRTPEESDIIDVIMKQSKQRQDSIEQYTAAARPELAAKEEAELVVLRDYLPKPLSDEELAAAITACVAKVGASTPRDMGKVMQLLTAQYKGRFDGKAVSETVKAMLQ